MRLDKINPFESAIKKNRPLILDGAIGSQLHKMGADNSTPLWSSKANVDSPELVFRLHQKYIEAGADIITTNTFRTNPAAVNQLHGYSVSKLVKAAVRLAHSAAKQKFLLIAGSNAPAEDCYKYERKLTHKELTSNHTKHIDLLIDNGVNFILNETQSHFDEIKIICTHCAENNIPFVVSLFSADSNTILSGEQLTEVINFIESYDPLAISINCVSLLSFEKIKKSFNTIFPKGFYLNLGLSQYSENKIKRAVSPDKYSEFVKKHIDNSTGFVGSCCGSSPAHTKMLKEVINDL
ncbi:MAG: homocysteine S-methyltransferase family protein [Ignavibacteriaceae bacterium]|nr:homocysteine S-methyltransferase family protein [Ignavibacteriaceae bacterium]